MACEDPLCDDGKCWWCEDRVATEINLTQHGPLVGSNHTSNRTWVGDKKHYVTGHVMMWADAVMHILIAFLVGQLWWKTKFKDDALNPWYGYAWKAIQAGAMVSSGLQTLFFPFTFMNLHVYEKLAYVMLWLINGCLLGIMSATTGIAYLIVAWSKYEDDPNFAKKNITYTLMLYLLMLLKSVVMGHKHIGSVIFFMLGDEINWICDKNDDLCKGWGLEFWWNEAWNE